MKTNRSYEKISCPKLAEEEVESPQITALDLQAALYEGLQENIGIHHAFEHVLFRRFSEALDRVDVPEATVAYWRLLNLYGHVQNKYSKSTDEKHNLLASQLATVSHTMASEVEHLTDPTRDFIEHMAGIYDLRNSMVSMSPVLKWQLYTETPQDRERVKIYDEVDVKNIIADIPEGKKTLIVGLGVSSILLATAVASSLRDTTAVKLLTVPEYSKDHVGSLINTLASTPDTMHIALVSVYGRDADSLGEALPHNASFHLV